jgi:hypothetical protein
MTGHHAMGEAPVPGQLSGRLINAFYLVVLITALAGASDAAVGWLNWPLAVVVVLTGSIELGGVALSAFADDRRQLGEPAYAARALSAAVAVGAVAVNWFGHVTHHLGQAALFSGMSALGYLVYLLVSAARRRDRLRAANKMVGTPPVYDPAQWIQHPWVTRRARLLAMEDPDLGVLPSLRAAAEEIRAEKRNKAIAHALKKRIKVAVGPESAKIAVLTVDLKKVAAGIARQADYPRLIDLITADLTPEKLTGKTARPRAERTADTGQVDLSGALTSEMSGHLSGQLTGGQRELTGGQVPVTVGQAPANKVPAVRLRRPEVPVEVLADTLAEEFKDRLPGRPTALEALRKEHGSCSTDRARLAMELLASRRAAAATPLSVPVNGHATPDLITTGQ